MTKQQWDIWTLDFPGRGEHPAVLISHPDRCARASVVNMLYCTSQRQSRSARENEILLNGSDGLDWETFCVCDHLYSVEASQLVRKRGRVTAERRRAIRRKLIQFYRLLADD
ncbi:MAG TPA: type II toxin-antitoxin system PemK/MazF family toxin [Methylomirabilota bacterium]|nr:type II toxin-antitoxin system PemK/MazF family toxin [Methylomirabilota bacterium]